MKETLLIEKSQQESHIRVSKKGKPFPAGKGEDKTKAYYSVSKFNKTIRDDAIQLRNSMNRTIEALINRLPSEDKIQGNPKKAFEIINEVFSELEKIRYGQL